MEDTKVADDVRQHCHMQLTNKHLIENFEAKLFNKHERKAKDNQEWASRETVKIGYTRHRTNKTKQRSQ